MGACSELSFATVDNTLLFIIMIHYIGIGAQYLLFIIFNVYFIVFLQKINFQFS